MERKKIELRRASTAMAKSVNFPKNNNSNYNVNSSSTRDGHLRKSSAAGTATPATTTTSSAAAATPRDPRSAVAVPIRSNAPASNSPGGQRKGG